jgi:thiol:disulfide interchange protein DsbD
VPVRTTAAGQYKVPLKITGKYADGKPLALETKGATLWVSDDLKVHLAPAARIKKTPVVAGEPNAVIVDVTFVEFMGEHYHVYGAAISQDVGVPVKAMLLPVPGATGKAWKGGGPASPAGEKYDAPFAFEIPFVPLKSGKVDARVMVFWQACTEEFCDPNVVVYVPVAFDVEDGSGKIEAMPPANGTAGAGGGAAKTGAADEAGASDGEDLKKKSIWELILLAIGGGLIALAMPCTYPLIPITISFFTKQAEARDGKVTGLALAYGAGIVVIFTAIGLLFGKTIDAFAAGATINIIFAVLFLVFGLSLLGLFEIRLPGWFNDLAAKASGTGGYLSVFVMGMTLVITSFTCTAPIVGLVLGLTGSGAAWRIGLTMAVFGLTMAIPFVFLSLSPKAMQALPRSGEWMKTLKVSLGIVELGLVLKFLSNVDFAIGTFLIGRELFLVLWGLSFLLTGFYLLGVHKAFLKDARWAVGPKQAGIGIAMLAVTAYLYSGLGGRVLDDNIEAFLPRLPDRKQEYVEAFRAVVKEDYEQGVAKAKELGAPIFLDFTGFV